MKKVDLIALRGGYWFGYASFLRVASRNNFTPFSQSYNFGVRFVRSKR